MKASVFKDVDKAGSASGGTADVVRHARQFEIGHRNLASWMALPGRYMDMGVGMSEIRTLIVDHSSVMRKVVERALRQAGLDLLVVDEAGNGNEGLELLKARPFDLVLSDINMPAMDGLEFLRQIRAQNLAPGVPVVMVTTESSEEQIKQAILAGAQGYIRKPFTADEVKQRVLPLVIRPWREDTEVMNDAQAGAMIWRGNERYVGGGRPAGAYLERRRVPISLRDSVRQISDPRNLDESVDEVFRQMLGIRCERDEGPTAVEGEPVTAVVGFGGLLSGACVFRLGAGAAIRIAAQMTGMEFRRIDDTVKDGIGEICNILAGSWRGKVPELAANCGLSIPAVITGREYSLHVRAPEFQVHHVYRFGDDFFEASIVCYGLR